MFEIDLFSVWHGVRKPDNESCADLHARSIRHHADGSHVYQHRIPYASDNLNVTKRRQSEGVNYRSSISETEQRKAALDADIRRNSA